MLSGGTDTVACSVLCTKYLCVVFCSRGISLYFTSYVPYRFLSQYRKGGSENTSNNTFAHNGGGYDSETFISTQLFSAGIEPNTGPDGGNLSYTGEESKATSTGEGDSLCSPQTASLNTVQRKRSRAHQAVATEKLAKQRLGDEAVETKRKDVSNFFSVHLRSLRKCGGICCVLTVGKTACRTAVVV
jgi:hypothetical protein